MGTDNEAIAQLWRYVHLCEAGERVAVAVFAIILAVAVSSWWNNRNPPSSP